MHECKNLKQSFVLPNFSFFFLRDLILANFLKNWIYFLKLLLAKIKNIFKIFSRKLILVKSSSLSYYLIDIINFYYYWHCWYFCCWCKFLDLNDWNFTKSLNFTWKWPPHKWEKAEIWLYIFPEQSLKTT